MITAYRKRQNFQKRGIRVIYEQFGKRDVKGVPKQVPHNITSLKFNHRITSQSESSEGTAIHIVIWQWFYAGCLSCGTPSHQHGFRTGIGHNCSEAEAAKWIETKFFHGRVQENVAISIRGFSPFSSTSRPYFRLSQEQELMSPRLHAFVTAYITPAVVMA